MKNILKKEEIETLNWIIKAPEIKADTKNRAKGILLKNKGRTFKDIADILDVKIRITFNWVAKYEKYGVYGLFRKKGQGRKSSLKKKDEILKKIEEIADGSLSINQMLRKLKKIKCLSGISRYALKKYLKEIKFSYKRARKIVDKSTKFKNYFEKLEKINKFIEESKNGEIDLYYFDESGFSLNSSIPYTWSKQGKPTEIINKRSNRLNVLGFLNIVTQKLHYEIKNTWTNGEIVKEVFEKFIKTLDKNKKTIVILDNAKYHKSKLINKEAEKWKKENLELFYLPTYSPELNLIEILWKHMKYEWFDLNAYSSVKNLRKHITNILDNYGKEYVINFT